MDRRIITPPRFFFFFPAFFLALNTIVTTTLPAGIEGAIGVNYGLKGNNLPSPDKVVSLYKSRNIQKLRIFNPDTTVLAALKNSDIQLVLGTLNEDLQSLADNTSFAANWVHAYVVPYAHSVDFRYITAGNEVIPSDLSNYVLPAMRNLDAALKNANLSIPVTTAVAGNVLGASYPPSQGAFAESTLSVMTPIAAFLEANKAPLLVNVYPYFAYIGSTKEISLEYAMFTSKKTVVRDGSLEYSNLFDAMVDSMYAALDKVNAQGVELVVSETGWPSGGGGVGATLENAKTYNNNAVSHVMSGKGTPRRPGKALETYLFAMFNENEKPGAGTEQHFGLYQPDMSEAYHVSFS